MRSFALLTGCEGQGEEGRCAPRAHGDEIIFDDGDGAVVTVFTKALEDLHGTVGVGLDELADGSLMWVELAGARDRAPGSEVGLSEPVADGAGVE